MPGPLGKGHGMFLFGVCYLASSEQGTVPPWGEGGQPPLAPQPGEQPLQVPKAVGTKQVLMIPEVPPGPRGHPGLAAGKDLGDPRGQEEQGCSWSPGLWVSGEKALQRGSTPGDTDWCHSPARGYHPLFPVLLDLLPGPLRAKPFLPPRGPHR